jgi:hypothetical protein
MAFDDETWGVGGPDGPDGYRFWTFCVDFAAPSNSSFTAGPFVTGPNFDSELCGFSRDCIPQPGTSQALDTLGQFTMYRFANRYFPGVGLRGAISHTVDSGGNVAGVRWAEIDLDNHTILDTGTFAPGDGVDRWMPSISIDGVGNLGVVFTKSGTGPGGASCGNGICEAGNGEDCVSCAADCNGKQNGNPNGRFCCGDGDGQNPVPCSDPRCTSGGLQCTETPVPGGDVFPSVYFSGRETTDPSGTLQAESVCIDGSGVQLGGNRWGDYATVSVDPVDDCTFWVTNEYVETTGSFQWDTQICAFSFNSCTGGGGVCGDGTCDPGESCANCAQDCTIGAEVCTGGVDEDCNGLIDCDDTVACGTDPACICLPKNASCSQNSECCSNICKPNGRCR